MTEAPVRIPRVPNILGTYPLGYGCRQGGTAKVGVVASTAGAVPSVAGVVPSLVGGCRERGHLPLHPMHLFHSPLRAPKTWSLTQDARHTRGPAYLLRQHAALEQFADEIHVAHHTLPVSDLGEVTLLTAHGEPCPCRIILIGGPGYLRRALGRRDGAVGREEQQRAWDATRATDAVAAA